MRNHQYTALKHSSFALFHFLHLPFILLSSLSSILFPARFNLLPYSIFVIFSYVLSPLFPFLLLSFPFLLLRCVPVGGCEWRWWSRWHFRSRHCSLRSQTAQSHLPTPVRPLGMVQCSAVHAAAATAVWSSFLLLVSNSYLSSLMTPFFLCPWPCWSFSFLLISYSFLFPPLLFSFFPFLAMHLIIFFSLNPYTVICRSGMDSGLRLESPASNTDVDNHLSPTPPPSYPFSASFPLLFSLCLSTSFPLPPILPPLRIHYPPSSTPPTTITTTITITFTRFERNTVISYFCC